MPLFYQISNDNPYSASNGQAVFYQAKKISPPPPPPDAELCLCNIGCQPVEKVCFSLDGDERKNDKSQFLFKKTVSSDSIQSELHKDGKKVADVTSSLGKLYSFSIQPLYYAYEVEWGKVANLHGVGRYTIVTKFNIVGSEYVTESRVFHVYLYSEMNADGTVKIESYQTGNIIGSEFDYTDLLKKGWYQSYRIKGKFGNKRPVIEQDNYQDNQYNIIQIQDKISKEYTLTSKYISAEVANQLFYDNMLANKILITDYNIINHERYTRIDVIPVDVDEVANGAKDVRQTWKFKERKDNFIKTNY